MIDGVASVLTAGNLLSSVVAGLFAGLYLAVFHPALPGRAGVRRALLMAWYFGFLGTVLYAARIAFAAAGGQPDVARLIGALILWILCAGVVGFGAWLGAAIRDRFTRWRGRRLAARSGGEDG